MRRNNRIAGRIWTAVALAVVLFWGIPAVAPAALADSAVAPAAPRPVHSRTSTQMTPRFAYSSSEVPDIQSTLK